jgi:hypothetical protein
MPYRRLPKTDQARLTALRIAIKKGDIDGINNPVISLKMQNEAKVLLSNYENLLFEYKQSLVKQTLNSRRSKNNVKTARLYVSHFIQVLNLSIIRGEIKKEHKTYYGLDVDSFSVPDLTSEKMLLEWGEKIVKGEAERIKNGGSPIYNPNIAKVRVYFDIFKDNQTEQKILQMNSARYLDMVKKIRVKCDEILLEIWNQVEAYFIDYPPKEKLEKCKTYGLVYYYRRGEERE